MISASSVALLLLATAVFYLSWRKLEDTKSELEKVQGMEDRQEKIATINTGRELENFETKIENISEKLKVVAEERYSLEEIDSYKNLMQEIDQFSADDDIAEDLLNSFRYLKQRSHEDNLTEEEKKLIREASFAVLRFPSNTEPV